MLPVFDADLATDDNDKATREYAVFLDTIQDKKKWTTVTTQL